MTTKRLTAEDLSVIEVRANAATGGEWVAYEPTEFRGDIRIAKAFDEYPDGRQKNTYVGRLVESHVGHEKPRREDGKFIAAARTDVPDLIAEVRALTAERDDASAELARVTAERDELRAIVEGRRVAPTDAELTAHDANGARWLVKLDGGKNTAMVVEVMAWPSSREWLLARGASRWWPIDANGPCAWPKVTP